MVRKINCLILGISLCLFVMSCESEKEVSDDYMLCEMKGELMMSAAKATWMYEGRVLNDFRVKDINGIEENLSSLLDDEYKVIFVYSEHNCKVCVDNEVEKLADLASKIGSDRILILVEGSGLRQVLSYMIDRDIKTDVRLISSDALGDIMKNENMPWVCVMKKDMRIENFFIPIKEIPHYNDVYHDMVYKRYFEVVK